MRKNIQNKCLLLLLTLVIGATYSCKETTFLFEEDEKTGIYFQTDSITYSFGVTPIEIKDYTLRIPLKIMGAPTPSERVFVVKEDESKTTATANVHYELTANPLVMVDSTNAYLDLKINRDALGDEEFKDTIELQSSDHFVPVNEQYKRVVVYFNNQVNRPDWKDWRGNPTWPEFNLGPWHPSVYIKFIELFREMETLAPTTYHDMVEQFGVDLKDVPGGWPWDYNYSMEKYVLIPLYIYFMEDHPELGITVPKPDSYQP